jgi:hypothetical protein
MRSGSFQVLRDPWRDAARALTTPVCVSVQAEAVVLTTSTNPKVGLPGGSGSVAEARVCSR